MEKSDLNKDGKTRSQCATRVGGGGCHLANERQRLEDELSKVKKIIQDKDQQVQEKNKCSEADQASMREIRNEKETSIKDRKRNDADVAALNNQLTTKRDQFLKLQGNLQYRTEENLNEAIKRLQVQLETNNYKVLEERKIVQEIDRLKRSKKTLTEYLTLRVDIDKIRVHQRTMRDERETLHRHVTNLKCREDKLKKETIERRSAIELLKKELDELHDRKRNIIADLKQIPAAPHPKPQTVAHRRPSSFKRKDSNYLPREDGSFKGSQESFGYWKKEKTDPLAEKKKLCNTLTTYMQRLLGSSPLTPTTPLAPEVGFAEATQTEIHDGEKLLVLLKKDDEEESGAKANRGSKKGKKDRRKTQNKLLSHTPDMIDQFSKLGLNPPSTLNDVSTCLEALAAKAQELSCEANAVNQVLDNDSIKIASTIAQVENDILEVNCDNHLDLAAVTNGNGTTAQKSERPLVNDVDIINDNEHVDNDNSREETNIDECSKQISKVHLINIPLSGQELNGISSTHSFGNCLEQLADDAKDVNLVINDHMPSLIPNVEVYTNGEGINDQSFSNELLLTVSLLSSDL